MSAGGQEQLFQNSYYVGIILMNILYGVELMLYFQIMQRLRGRRGSSMFLMLFSTMLHLLITVSVIAQSLLGQEMWVVHQDYPGGLSAYMASDIYTRYQMAATATYILLQVLSDTVLIHRCWTIWGGNWKVIVVPCLFLLATLASGILDVYVMGASKNSNLLLPIPAYTGVVYVTLCIAVNVFTTCTICGRILHFGLKVHKRLGSEFASTYFTVASVIVESALPYTLFGIASLVALGMKSGVSILLLLSYATFTCVSPQMLLLRVAEGKAWNRAVTRTIAFAGNETLYLSHSRAQDSVAVNPGAADQSQSQSEVSKSEMAAATRENLLTSGLSVGSPA